MNCPKCVENLTPQNVGNSDGAALQVESCSDCKGFWFHEDSFDQVMDLKFKTIDNDPDKVSSEKIGSGNKHVSCPSCSKEMLKVPNDREFNMILVYCPHCSGYWANVGA